MKLLKTKPENINKKIENFTVEIERIKAELLKKLNDGDKKLDTTLFGKPIAIEPLEEVIENKEQATVLFTQTAYIKQKYIVENSAQEIAYHGVVEKRAKGIYIISDIILYPQTVTGATVDTDQQKYTQWIVNLPEETLNSLRYQGHSHVNMSVSPSSVDQKFYETLIENIDNFYVFGIQNKQGSNWFSIYDKDENILYEPEDLSWGIVGIYFGEIKDSIKNNISQTEIYDASKTATTAVTKAEKFNYNKPESEFYKKYKGWELD